MSKSCSPTFYMPILISSSFLFFLWFLYYLFCTSSFICPYLSSSSLISPPLPPINSLSRLKPHFHNTVYSRGQFSILMPIFCKIKALAQIHFNCLISCPPFIHSFSFCHLTVWMIRKTDSALLRKLEKESRVSVRWIWKIKHFSWARLLAENAERISLGLDMTLSLYRTVRLSVNFGSWFWFRFSISLLTKRKSLFVKVKM